jgi:hypothetical protein
MIRVFCASSVSFESRIEPQAIAEIVIIVDQQVVGRQYNDYNDNGKSNYFFHLFNKLWVVAPDVRQSWI